MLIIFLRVFFILVLMSISLSASTLLRVDPTESYVRFKTSAFGFMDVTGAFLGFDVIALIDQKNQIQRIETHIDVNSLDTGNSIRDRELREPGFFDVQRFSKIQFFAKKPVSITSTKLTGELMFKGIKKSLQLPIQLQFLKSSQTQDVVLEAKLENVHIKRSDFGVSGWPFIVSDDVWVDVYLILRRYVN